MITRVLTPMVWRHQHRVLPRVPVSLLSFLPREWQVLRMHPEKIKLRARARALEIHCKLVHHTRDISGGIAELGVRAGEDHILVPLWARRHGIRKTFYGFDSFCGWPPGGDNDHEFYRDGQPTLVASIVAARRTIRPPKGWIPDVFFAENTLPSLEWVQRRLAQYGVAEQVTLIEGWFQDTLSRFQEPLSLVRNDADLYESTLVGLRYLWPRLSFGGVFMNVSFGDNPGPSKALREFFKDRPEPVRQELSDNFGPSRSLKEFFMDRSAVVWQESSSDLRLEVVKKL